jgi:hypothetical protein
VFVGLAPAVYRLSVTGIDAKGEAFVASALDLALVAPVRREVRLVADTTERAPDVPATMTLALSQ